MKHYRAKYLVHTYNENISFRFVENVTVKNFKMKQLKRKSATCMFALTLTFSAFNKDEAIRMATINTDRSVLIFPDDKEPINYHLELFQKFLFWDFNLSDQFHSCNNILKFADLMIDQELGIK